MRGTISSFLLVCKKKFKVPLRAAGRGESEYKVLQSPAWVFNVYVENSRQFAKKREVKVEGQADTRCVYYIHIYDIFL